MIDLKTLEQLVIFSHTGTLCETAKKLHISQSTLTRGMQKLESEFGVCLCDGSLSGQTMDGPSIRLSFKLCL